MAPSGRFCAPTMPQSPAEGWVDRDITPVHAVNDSNETENGKQKHLLLQQLAYWAEKIDPDKFD